MLMSMHIPFAHIKFVLFTVQILSPLRIQEYIGTLQCEAVETRSNVDDIIDDDDIVLCTGTTMTHLWNIILLLSSLHQKRLQYLPLRHICQCDIISALLLLPLQQSANE